MLRGSIISDRGVYRLGEEIHFKAILRQNAPDGVRLLRSGTPVYVTVRDGQYRLVDERTVTVNSWSSAEWTLTLPAEGGLGNYSVRAILESDKPKPKPAGQGDPGVTPGPEADEYVPYQKVVNGSFLVAAYRRPDFRVDVTLAGTGAIAGGPLKGGVTARYLFGAPMGARPLAWAFTRAVVYSAPAAIYEKFPEERWEFVGSPDDDVKRGGEVRRDDATLAKTGDFALE